MNDQDGKERKDYPNSGEKIHMVLNQFIQYLYSFVIVQQVILIFSIY